MASAKLWPDQLDAPDVPMDFFRWARHHPNATEAWARCKNAGWLLWLAVRVGVEQKIVARAACACARKALPAVPAGEERPLRAIEAAEAWIDGKITQSEMLLAAQMSWIGSSTDKVAQAAAYAAVAALWSADESVIVDARAYDTSAAAEWAVQTGLVDQRQLADLVRSIIPCPPALATWNRTGPGTEGPS